MQNIAKVHPSALEALRYIRTYVLATSADVQREAVDAIVQLVAPADSAHGKRWQPGLLGVTRDGEGDLKVRYKKPRSDPGETYRIHDAPSFLLLILVLCYGGRIAMNSKGGGKRARARMAIEGLSEAEVLKYYPRITLSGRQFMANRLIAGTPDGRLTLEPQGGEDSYHDLRRHRFSTNYQINLAERPDRGQTGAKNGRETAKATILTVRQRLESAPVGTSEHLLARALSGAELSKLFDDLVTLVDGQVLD